MTADIEHTGYMHSAFFYRDDDEYLDALVPFVRQGLEKDELVRVAVPGRKLTLFRDALGDAFADVDAIDIAVAGRNPAHIMGLATTFLTKHRGRRTRIVGEVIWPGRTDDEYPGCVKHEALVDTAFTGHETLVVCPYDAAGLPEKVLTDARATHSLLWMGDIEHPSSDYAPDETFARYNQPLPSDPTAATCTVRVLDDLDSARSLAARYAQWMGLPAEGIAKLQLIVTELAANSLEHAGGVCCLAFFKRHGHIVCEASDGGRLDDPLAGRIPPPEDAVDGWGLFLVNSIADLVRMHATGSGTTIQAYLRLPAVLALTK